MSEKTTYNEVNASRAASAGLTEWVTLNVAWLVRLLGPSPEDPGHGVWPRATVIVKEWWSTQRLLEFLRTECFGLRDSANPNRYRPMNKDGTDTERPFGNNTADMVWLPIEVRRALEEALRIQAQQLDMWGHLWYPMRVQGGWVGTDVDMWVTARNQRKPLSNGAVSIEAEAWVLPPEQRLHKVIGGVNAVGLAYEADDMLTELDFNPQARVDY